MKSQLDRIEESLTRLINLVSEKEDNGFPLIPQKNLLEKLNISPNTLKSWEKLGLKRLNPPIENTRTVYYKLTDVLKFLEN